VKQSKLEGYAFSDDMGLFSKTKSSKKALIEKKGILATMHTGWDA